MKIKSPISDKQYELSFQTSKYMISSDSIWKLIAIVGEDEFERELEDHNLIDDQFIEMLFSRSIVQLFLDREAKKIWSYSREHQSEFQPISLNNALLYVDVDGIETAIEKGQVEWINQIS